MKRTDPYPFHRDRETQFVKLRQPFTPPPSNGSVLVRIVACGLVLAVIVGAALPALDWLFGKL